MDLDQQIAMANETRKGFQNHHIIWLLKSQEVKTLVKM